MTCPYATWDGAYVLGSLSASDRREFESHLGGCDACSRAVRDLAGLPGLLGRLEPEVFDEGDPEPVPDTLLPRLVDAMHRGQRRRTWLTAGLAAAAAVVVTMGGVVVLDHAGSGTPEAAPPTTAASSPTSDNLTMKAVGNDPMTATVAVTSVGWGTRIDLTCTYPHTSGGWEAGAYALVIHTTDGRTQRLATWNGLPGATMEFPAATHTRQRKIQSVEVTRIDGTPVAWAPVPL